MTTHTMDFFKKKLEEERKLLETELGDIGLVTDQSTGNWEPVPEAVDESTADENLNADRFETFTERSSTLDSLESRLESVKQALKNIEEGTYGICDECKEEIEKDRLEANPAARTCKAHMNGN